MKRTEKLIDRLVEGGLSPAELREAVAQLDSVVGGWRHCALAFMEAQSWGEIFRQVSDPVVEPRRQTLAGSEWGPARPRRWVRAAIAATIVLVAFSVGWLTHRMSVRGGSSQAFPLDTAAPSAIASHGRLGPEIVPASLPRPLSPGQSAQLPADRVPTVQEVARLRIGQDDASAAEVPILSGTGVSRSLLLDQPPPVSEHLRALWQRQGYELQQTRQYMSVQLADGHRAAVPVDRVQIRYVGREPL